MSFLVIYIGKGRKPPQSWQASRLVRQCESLLPVGRFEIPSLILKGDGTCVGWNFDLLKGPLFKDLCNPPTDLTDPCSRPSSTKDIFLRFFFPRLSRSLVCRLTSIQKSSPRLSPLSRLCRTLLVFTKLRGVFTKEVLENLRPKK